MAKSATKAHPSHSKSKALITKVGKNKDIDKKKDEPKEKKLTMKEKLCKQLESWQGVVKKKDEPTTDNAGGSPRVMKKPAAAPKKTPSGSSAVEPKAETPDVIGEGDGDKTGDATESRDRLKVFQFNRAWDSLPPHIQHMWTSAKSRRCPRLFLLVLLCEDVMNMLSGFGRHWLLLLLLLVCFKLLSLLLLDEVLVVLLLSVLSLVELVIVVAS
jgi:hypothetical protein